MVARRGDHLTHPVLGSDIARIDPQTGRPCLRRFYPAPIMKMDIRHDRHGAFAHNLLQRHGTRLIRDRNPHDIRPCLGRRLHLRHRRRHVARIRVGHGLDRNRRATAHGYVAHHDLATFPTIDIAPWADVVQRHLTCPASCKLRCCLDTAPQPRPQCASLFAAFRKFNENAAAPSCPAHYSCGAETVCSAAT